MPPAVSVVLPVYNAEETLGASIRSILSQTFGDFELIVINDGSTDRSASVIDGFDDDRIISHTQANKGLATTLNRGIELARGRYLARIDGDDVALPERLARQVRFLDERREVALLGTWAEIHEGDRPSGRFHRHPSDPAALRLELLLDNPFVHSSIMMRTHVVRALGGYLVERRTRFPEDYELWSRIARGHQVANLAEVLTIYREVPSSITRTGASEILTNVVSISANNLRAALSERPAAAQCLPFAGLYHGLPAGRITLPDALALWRDVSQVVAGPRQGWTAECLAIYQRVRRQLLSRFARRYLPKQVVDSLRPLANSLKR